MSAPYISPTGTGFVTSDKEGVGALSCPDVYTTTGSLGGAPNDPRSCERCFKDITRIYSTPDGKSLCAACYDTWKDAEHG